MNAKFRCILGFFYEGVRGKFNSCVDLTVVNEAAHDGDRTLSEERYTSTEDLTVVNEPDVDLTLSEAKSALLEAVCWPILEGFLEAAAILQSKSS